jgi:hypothetical protein
MFAVQRGAEVAAGVRVVLHHHAHTLDRQQLSPDPGWLGCPRRLRLLSLRRAGGLNQSPSLERGLGELRELRPINSRRLDS